MRIILLKDVKKLGKKDEVREVAGGYARNFLIPKKLAKPVTKKALEKLEREKRIAAQKAEKELKKIQEQVSKLDRQEIEIPVKVKESEEIYGSITPRKISQFLKKKGLKIKKHQIKLKEPIKKTGEYPITISFDHGLEAEIKINVTEEKKSKKRKKEKNE